jgi:hypothetical protein
LTLSLLIKTVTTIIHHQKIIINGVLKRESLFVNFSFRFFSLEPRPFQNELLPLPKIILDFDSLFQHVD